MGAKSYVEVLAERSAVKNPPQPPSQEKTVLADPGRLFPENKNNGSKNTNQVPRSGVRLDLRLRHKIFDVLKKTLSKEDVAFKYFDVDLFAPTPEQRYATSSTIKSPSQYDLPTVLELAQNASRVYAMPGLWGSDALKDAELQEAWDTCLRSPNFKYALLITGADKVMDVSTAAQTPYQLPSFLRNAKSHPFYTGTATLAKAVNLKIFSPKPEDFMDDRDWDFWQRNHPGGSVPLQFHLFIRSDSPRKPEFYFLNESEENKEFVSSPLPPPLLLPGRVGFFVIKESTYDSLFSSSLSKTEKPIVQPTFGGNQFHSYPEGGEGHRKLVDAGWPFFANDNQPVVKPGWFPVEISPHGKDKDLPKSVLALLLKEKGIKGNVRLILSTGRNKIKIFISRPSAATFPSWTDLQAKYNIKMFPAGPIRNPPVDASERLLSEEHFTIVNIPYFVSSFEVGKTVATVIQAAVTSKDTFNDPTVPSLDFTRAIHIFLPLTHTDIEKSILALREQFGPNIALRPIDADPVMAKAISDEQAFWEMAEREGFPE